MEKIRINLSVFAFVFSIVGAGATSYATVVQDPPVRCILNGVCQVINCTTVRRNSAPICPIMCDDGNYYPVTDLHRTIPLTIPVWLRIKSIV